MDAAAFTNRQTGHFALTVDGAQAFVPAPLPDSLPLPPEIILALDRASRAVATLDGIGETLDNPRLLFRPFMRREAVLSSQIEGTQASLTDLYEYEVAGRSRTPDAREVANYVVALEHGLRRLADLPICVRLVHEMHAELMRGVRGDNETIGDFRDRQVWIGAEGTPISDARFVPPPHAQVPDAMSEWEKWVNRESLLPPLIRAAMLHYQFETIHPYRDGNGRLGRLLIVLFLVSSGVLKTPLLYVSSFLERNRSAYYDHLLTLSQQGDWTPWLAFILRGVEEQARDAIARSRHLRDIQDRYRRLPVSPKARELAEYLFTSPMVTRPRVQSVLDLSARGAGLVVDQLIAQGVLVEVGQSRPALFMSSEIMDAIRT